MIAKLLGILDLFAALLLTLMVLGMGLSHYLLFIGAIVLLAKSLPFAFSLCIGCFIDIFVAILLILSIFFSLPVWLLVIGAVIIAQKGFLSFL